MKTHGQSAYPIGVKYMYADLYVNGNSDLRHVKAVLGDIACSYVLYKSKLRNG